MCVNLYPSCALITYQNNIKFKAFNDFKIFVKDAYNNPRVFIRDNDALTLLHSKMLNEFFQCFVKNSFDLTKSVIGEFHKTSSGVIAHISLLVIACYYLFSLRLFSDLCDFGIRNEKIMLIRICGLRDNRSRDGRTFWGRGWKRCT